MNEPTLKQLNYIRAMLEQLPDEDELKKEVRQWLLFSDKRTKWQASEYIEKLIEVTK